jgi:hypothetical protein
LTSLRACSDLYAHAELPGQELRALNVRVRKASWSKNHENTSDEKSHTWAPLRKFVEKKISVKSVAKLEDLTVFCRRWGKKDSLPTC